MKKTIRISAAEWEVMSVVWTQTSAPASAIAGLLHAKKQWSLATVRTLLRRLAGKGALHQQMEGHRYVYTARLTQAECARRESDSLFDRLLGRAPSEAILHLVKRTDLSKEDIQELRRILREKNK